MSRPLLTCHLPKASYCPQNKTQALNPSVPWPTNDPPGLLLRLPHPITLAGVHPQDHTLLWQFSLPGLFLPQMSAGLGPFLLIQVKREASPDHPPAALSSLRRIPTYSVVLPLKA